MKDRIATVLLIVFSLGLTAWTYAKYQIYLFNDCHMDQSGEVAAFCRAYIDYQPQIIFWRSFAIESVAIVAYLLFRKLACSRKS